MITLEPPRSMAPHAEASSGEIWRALGLSPSGLQRFLRVSQIAVGLRGDVAVLLSDDRRLRRLNRAFRDKDEATDVLSFPAGETPAHGHAGDLAISLQTAARQAKGHGHSLRDEVRVLLLHGVLHLAGMDHETDRGEMAKREAELRRRFGLPNGLIARAGKANAKGTKDAKNRKGRRVVA